MKARSKVLGGLALASLLIAGACSRDVLVGDEQGGTGAAPGGAGPSTTTSSGSSTSGGTGIGGGFNGTGGGFNPTGGGACPLPDNGGCPGETLFFDLIIDDGAPKLLSFDCGLVGYLVGGGGPVPPPEPASGGLLHIDPSSSQTGDFMVLSGDMPSLPGSITTGYTRYTQYGSEYETTLDDATLSITSFTVVGAIIEGTFAASVTRTWGDAGPDMASIHGQFRVCRDPDKILP